MPAGTLGEPVADRLRLVARRVVHDDVHVEAGRNIALDLVEEPAELLGSMARHALADHRAGLHVRLHRHRGDEAREQRRGAVALVIVRAPLDLPRTIAKIAGADVGTLGNVARVANAGATNLAILTAGRARNE